MPIGQILREEEAGRRNLEGKEVGNGRRDVEERSCLGSCVRFLNET